MQLIGKCCSLQTIWSRRQQQYLSGKEGDLCEASYTSNEAYEKLTAFQYDCILQTFLPELHARPKAIIRREKWQGSNIRYNGSIDIGLAIVKQICNINHFNMQYDYAEGWHIIQIIFEESTENVKPLQEGSSTLLPRKQLQRSWS
jgi:hypothetical protein